MCIGSQSTVGIRPTESAVRLGVTRASQASNLLMIGERLRDTKAQRVQALGSSGVPQLLGDNVIDIDMPYPGYPPL